MHEPRGGERLAAEARDELLVLGEVLGEQLDGDVALEPVGRRRARRSTCRRRRGARPARSGRRGPGRPSWRRRPRRRAARAGAGAVVGAGRPVGVGARRAGRRCVRRCPSVVSSSVSVVLGVGGRRLGRSSSPCVRRSVGRGLAASASVSGSHVAGTRSPRLLDARLQARRAAARRPSRAGRAPRSAALATARSAAVAVAGAVVGRRSGPARSSGSTRRSTGCGRRRRRRRRAAAVRRAEHERGERRAGRASLIDRTPGARRASPAGARRGSRPRRPAMSYSVRRQRGDPGARVEQQPRGARVAVARLADAARVEEPLAVGDVDLVAAAARAPVAGSPSGRTNDSATCEWPTSDTRSGWASRHSSASSAESTYSQTGSRGRAWYRPTPRAAPDGLQRGQPVAMLGVDDLLRPARGERGAAARTRRAARSPVTARSWLPARQTSACSRASATAVVGIGAVADDVAQAPDRLGRAGARRRRAPPRRRGGCRGCRRRWRPAWISRPAWPWGILYERGTPPPGCRGRGAAFVVAEAAVLLLRPRDGVIAPAPVDPGSYFTPAAARARARLPPRPARALRRGHGDRGRRCSSWLVRRPPRAPARALPAAGARGGGRRRGAVGGLSPSPRSRSAPSATSARSTSASRPRTGGRGWATSAKSTAIGAVFAGAGAARRARRSCAASRGAGGCPAASLVVGFATVSIYAGPGRPRPDLQPLHGAARRAHARRRAGAGARGGRRRRRGLRGRRQPAHDGLQRLRHRAGAHEARRPLRQPAQGLHAATRCASSSPTSSATSTTATCRAGCSTSRSWRRRRCSPPRC